MPKRDQIGFFYAAQLYPDVLPLVVKFGFTKNPQTRIISHRSQRYAPAAEMLCTWPAVRMWERFIIRRVTTNCRQVMETEVYLVDDVEAITRRVDAFVAVCDVTRIATPPYIPHNERADRLLSVSQANWLYGVPEEMLRALVADGTLRSYDFRAVPHHSSPCIEEMQLEAWISENKGAFVDDRKFYVPLDARQAPPPPAE